MSLEEFVMFVIEFWRVPSENEGVYGRCPYRPVIRNISNPEKTLLFAIT